MLECLHCKKTFYDKDTIFRIEKGKAYCEDCANELFTLEEQRLAYSGLAEVDTDTHVITYTKDEICTILGMNKESTVEHICDELNQRGVDSFTDDCFWTEYDSECDD